MGRKVDGSGCHGPARADLWAPVSGVAPEGGNSRGGTGEPGRCPASFRPSIGAAAGPHPGRFGGNISPCHLPAFCLWTVSLLSKRSPSVAHACPPAQGTVREDRGAAGRSRCQLAGVGVTAQALFPWRGQGCARGFSWAGHLHLCSRTGQEQPLQNNSPFSAGEGKALREPPALGQFNKRHVFRSSQARPHRGWMPSVQRQRGPGAKGIGVLLGGGGTTHTSSQPDGRAALRSL